MGLRICVGFGDTVALPGGLFCTSTLSNHSEIILDFREELQKWYKDVSKCQHLMTMDLDPRKPQLSTVNQDIAASPYTSWPRICFLSLVA